MKRNKIKILNFFSPIINNIILLRFFKRIFNHFLEYSFYLLFKSWNIRRNKKAIEMTLSTIITFVILILVLIVIIMFFSEHFTSNNSTLINVGNNALNNAKGIK